jgi:hypothetical protein
MVFDITDMNNIVKTRSKSMRARSTTSRCRLTADTVRCRARAHRTHRRGAADLATFRASKVASTFEQELTGGVHNMFATNDNLFAVSGGAKYVISTPATPIIPST